jgi:hypothetical protein
MVVRRRTCRLCESDHLLRVFSLGALALSDFVAANTPVVTAPLDLMLCDPAEGGCSLVQLGHSVDRDLLYRHYWYRSGVNQTMTKALADVVASCVPLVDLTRQDIVIDIGCNDGTLLRSYPSPSPVTVGFEPAGNLIDLAAEGTSLIINDYFSHDAFVSALGSSARAKVVTSIAMFYDADDPNTLVSDVAQVLSQDGIWIIQMAYLPSMLKTNGFDNICHEHLTYYSLSTMKMLLGRHGLEIRDAVLNDINGGSFRIYACHRSSTSRGSPGAANRLRLLETYERASSVRDTGTYTRFAERANQIGQALHEFCETEYRLGKQIHVYGASTKGNTLLQFADLAAPLISMAAERNPAKWGLQTVATNIPIVSEEESRAQRPDYYLVLPWHFRNEAVRREEAFLRRHGGMLFPLPIPSLVTMERAAVSARRLVNSFSWCPG